MIRAAGWFNRASYGAVGPSGKVWRKTSPIGDTTSEIPGIVERPVKYLSRMTEETRCCLCAAALAMKEADLSGGEIGLISTESRGVLKANDKYFRDYVATGRSLGRGNLFIYTLPTSSLGEVAIALTLTGPSMFIQLAGDHVTGMLRQAEQMIEDGEAKTMLGIWGSMNFQFCVAVTAGEGGIDRDEIIQAATG
jgi:hypothetical protein